MPLTGEEIEQLRDAIAAAFDDDALVQMVRFKLGKDLFKMVARGPRDTVAFNLINRAEQEGWTRSLITAVALVRRDNEQVRRYCEAHAPWALTPPESGDLVGGASSAVEALGSI